MLWLTRSGVEREDIKEKESLFFTHKTNCPSENTKHKYVRNLQSKYKMSVNPDVGKILYQRRYSQIKKAREELKNFGKGFYTKTISSQA